MKTEPQKSQQHVFFLATENVILHVNQPFKIRHDMIETKNFIPEAFLIHQFHDSRDSAVLNLIPGMGALQQNIGRDIFSTLNPSGSPFAISDPFRNEVAYFSDEDDDEDEDWDEEDEDWDDEDEDWEEEDEDWDEEDEDWDDEEEGEDDWSEDEDE